MTEPIQLQTERLLLIASTPAIARAEATDRGELARLLGARIHEAWPPGENDQEGRDYLCRQLEEHPEAVGFLGWSWLVRPDAAAPERRPLLIGGGGFKGPPDADGTIEIGYSIVEEYYGRGLATEAVGATLAWAFGDPRVRRVVAETLPELRPSQRVLEKSGFVRTEEPPAGPGSLRYELTRERWSARNPA
ncbi:MAG TPA: GNAT family N-acetyltransferase [Candidatus Omnitrophota bacterium]|nr:GNAT family N-acetyltransferase [Candidatus Omnitrophota bacterium]